ncbi:ATP-binding protein [Sphingomonas sp. BN140010]|uniref:histidine kinase n=1 Tax=Sphingomonas arvum TaxID=2992113 RepID=A0ABT3JDR1_9SPHN|nr:ATP-binding protein [Sphingomonas sp. BN140010]MCW3797207.1 ATP-binding protein [Sphingomonas sp. BN140010]
MTEQQQHYTEESGEAFRAAEGRLPLTFAHDFRNMMQCAASALHFLNRELCDHSSPEIQRTAATAARAVERASRMANHLLTAAGAEQRQVDVRETILMLSELLRLSLGGHIRLETLTTDRLPPVHCAPQRLEDALLNLALNARDAMPEGGVLLFEARSCHLHRQAESCVVISVSDNGTGMPPEVVRQAFRPFFTTKKDQGGTGLGLSSVRAFVDQLGGTIEVISRPAGGTTIKLHLPTDGLI